MSVGRFEDLSERFPDVRIADAVVIEQEPLEDPIVEAATRGIVRVAIESADVGQESKAVLQQLGSCRERRATVGVFGLDPTAVLSQLVDPLPDLVLWETFLGEVEQAFLTLVEFGEPLSEGVVQATQAGLFIGHGLAHVVRDAVDKVVGQVESCVVLDHVVFD